MALTADTMSKVLLPTGDSSRSADVAYDLGTGKCWFRGANVSPGINESTVDDLLIHFHDGETADPFLTMGSSAYYSLSFFVGVDECYMDASNAGVWVSSNNQDLINRSAITVFYS